MAATAGTPDLSWIGYQGKVTHEFLLSDRPCCTLALHAASPQQDGGHQVGLAPLQPPTSCLASPLRVRVRAGRADWQEVNIYQNFHVSRKLKFDYLDGVSTLRIPSNHSHRQSFRKDVLAKLRVFMWTVFIICNVLWIT